MSGQVIAQAIDVDRRATAAHLSTATESVVGR